MVAFQWILQGNGTYSTAAAAASSKGLHFVTKQWKLSNVKKKSNIAVHAMQHNSATLLHPLHSCEKKSPDKILARKKQHSFYPTLSSKLNTWNVVWIWPRSSAVYVHTFVLHWLFCKNAYVLFSSQFLYHAWKRSHINAVIICVNQLFDIS